MTNKETEAVDDHELNAILRELAQECYTAMHDPGNAGQELPLIEAHMRYAIARREHVLKSRALPRRQAGYYGPLAS